MDFSHFTFTRNFSKPTFHWLGQCLYDNISLKNKDISLHFGNLFTWKHMWKRRLMNQDTCGDLAKNACANSKTNTQMKMAPFCQMRLNCVNSKCEAKTLQNKPERTQACWTDFLSSQRLWRDAPKLLHAYGMVTWSYSVYFLHTIPYACKLLQFMPVSEGTVLSLC